MEQSEKVNIEKETGQISIKHTRLCNIFFSPESLLTNDCDFLKKKANTYTDKFL